MRDRKKITYFFIRKLPWLSPYPKPSVYSCWLLCAKHPSGQSQNFDVDSTLIFRSRFSTLFRRQLKKTLKYRRRFDVASTSTVKNINAFSTTVEIFLRFSMLFQQIARWDKCTEFTTQYYSLILPGSQERKVYHMTPIVFMFTTYFLFSKFYLLM